MVSFSSRGRGVVLSPTRKSREAREEAAAKNGNKVRSSKSRQMSGAGDRKSRGRGRTRTRGGFRGRGRSRGGKEARTDCNSYDDDEDDDDYHLSGIDIYEDISRRRKERRGRSCSPAGSNSSYDSSASSGSRNDKNVSWAASKSDTDDAAVGTVNPPGRQQLRKQSTHASSASSIQVPVTVNHFPPLDLNSSTRADDVDVEVNKVSKPSNQLLGAMNLLLSAHPGQLDIYARSPVSFRLRKYSKPPRLEGQNHILVKVLASTVSIHDNIGKGSGDQECHVPGRQVMGEVYRIGNRVWETKNINEGDRVVALTPYGYGGNARYISIPASSAMYVPPEVKDENAICLVESYMAAYQMLNLGRPFGTPLTDANVLIIGGSDPVGQALVELALKEGANVYASADYCHREYLEKMGVIWFPNKPRKFSKLRKQMDVVIDTLCLDGYKSSYEALNGQGKLVCTSNPPVRDNGDLFEQMSRSWTICNATYVWSDVVFYDVNKSFEENPHMFEHEFRYLLCKLRNKEIEPKISGKIALNQVPKVQTLIRKGLPNGTIVVLPWELDLKENVTVEHVD